MFWNDDDDTLTVQENDIDDTLMKQENYVDDTLIKKKMMLIINWRNKPFFAWNFHAL